jgi:hypothetical protein
MPPKVPSPTLPPQKPTPPKASSPTLPPQKPLPPKVPKPAPPSLKPIAKPANFPAPYPEPFEDTENPRVSTANQPVGIKEIESIQEENLWDTETTQSPIQPTQKPQILDPLVKKYQETNALLENLKSDFILGSISAESFNAMKLDLEKRLMKITAELDEKGIPY